MPDLPLYIMFTLHDIDDAASAGVKSAGIARCARALMEAAAFAAHAGASRDAYAARDVEIRQSAICRFRCR